MFVEPDDESDDDLPVDSSDGSVTDSSDETIVEKSKRLIGGLIFEYGFADAM
jgi:hypothetical protein